MLIFNQLHSNKRAYTQTSFIKGHKFLFDIKKAKKSWLKNVKIERETTKLQKHKVDNNKMKKERN